MQELKSVAAAGVALLTIQVTLAARQAVHPVTGRPIAQVMSHLGASWLDRPEREVEEAPSRAVELLALKSGAVVADVGAGSGYISEKLSRAVAPRAACTPSTSSLR